jgi:hypothetical protein
MRENIKTPPGVAGRPLSVADGPLSGVIGPWSEGISGQTPRRAMPGAMLAAAICTSPAFTHLFGNMTDPEAFCNNEPLFF